MKKTSTILIAAIGLIAIAIVFAVIIPQKISKNNSAKIEGVVNKLTEGGMGDVAISLQGATGVFYISKGLKKGINTDSLRELLLDKKVTLYYTKPGWLSGLSPQAGPLQITELAFGDQIIFSEFSK